MENKTLSEILSDIEVMGLNEKIEALNTIRSMLHDVSPFKSEPIDFVKWVKTDSVHANDYNPNSVAPPEMALLEHSIEHDGYTQPVVGWQKDDVHEVVDGFHRTKVAKTSKVVIGRLKGYMPIVSIASENQSRNDRISSTIRHNRARGKHQIDAMSEIVIELKNRNWTNSRIARELGMDEEEVLRLCQISGMENLFSDKDFSRAWEADDADDEFEDFDDYLTDSDLLDYRIPHQGNVTRIFHTYDKWECEKAGFFKQNFEGLTSDECKQKYCDFLSDSEAFKAAAMSVISEWKNSCEHYLTNFAMNRIAWIGQASMCYATGIPAKYCGGYNLLNDKQKDAANQIALDVINIWMIRNGRDALTMDEASSAGRQVEIY